MSTTQLQKEQPSAWRHVRDAIRGVHHDYTCFWCWELPLAYILAQ